METFTRLGVPETQTICLTIRRDDRTFARMGGVLLNKEQREVSLSIITSRESEKINPRKPIMRNEFELRAKIVNQSKQSKGMENRSYRHA